MIDSYGRPVNSIRVSVTKECNLNCFYCHREGIKGEKDILMPEDFETLFKVASSLGIKKVKFTGGEPLERKDLEDIVRLSKKYFNDISITTNGTYLKERAWSLYDAGLNRINISLHTLNRETYRKITGMDFLNKVLEGIDEAIKTPLNPIKINMVLMRGLNDDQVKQMMEFVKNSKMVLQIIELEVPIEGLKTPWYVKYHLSLDDVEKYLISFNPEIRKNSLHNRDKFLVIANGSRYEVELVKPMHNTDFCKNCTRMRFTYDGKLKPCIFRNDNLVPVLEELRSGNEEKLKEKFQLAVKLREPYWKD
ncbi:MAG: GTP 3',8-cyclase MoaA [Thermoplasmata archaeon]